MKINFIILLVVLFGGPRILPLRGQQMMFQGKITFERKENMHKMLEDEHGNWADEMRKRLPKFRTDIFQLVFNRNQSSYRLIQEEENTLAAASYWRISWDNQVNTQFKNRQYTCEKTVYDRNYHVVDSIPVLKWKLTGEYREIAGYSCRKATTIIMDSLFVIAFYTDAIPVNGGPESIQGLPGMVLGVVIPRISYTIFATKVENAVVEEKMFALKPIKKAKATNREAMYKEINDAVSDWGKWGRKMFWRTII